MSKLLPLALALPLLAACSGGADPDQLTRDGVVALNAGQYDEAFEQLDQAVQAMQPTDPKYGQAAVNRCRALAHMDATLARNEFLELASAHATVVEERDYEMVADALRSRAHLTEAIEVLEAGMERYSESPRLVALRDAMGKAAEASGDSAALERIKGLGYVGD